MSRYYEIAEDGFDTMWSELIWPRIAQSDFSCTLELAPGHGRNTRRLLELATRLVLVDVNEECIRECRTRFSNSPHVEYRVGSGFDFRGVADAEVTFVYCFDSMVHFEPEVVRCYLADLRRILRPGGTAFLHHSNFSANPGGDFRENPHWRNEMSQGRFSSEAVSAGLEVLESEVIGWGSRGDWVDDLDCLTSLQRPA